MKRSNYRRKRKWVIGVLFLSQMLLFSPIMTFADEAVEDDEAVGVEADNNHDSTDSIASDSKGTRKTEDLNESAVAAIAASVVTEGAAITPSISNQTAAPSK